MTTIIKQIPRSAAPAADELINLSGLERYISIFSGIRLGVSGVRGLISSPITSLLKLGAGAYLLKRGVTGHCDLYARAGKLTTRPANITISSQFLVNLRRQKVYEFWRKLDNLPLFMSHLESVEVKDEKISHWVLKLPTGLARLSWDAEIVEDEPGELIGWSSLPGSAVDNAGKIRFEDTLNEDVTLVNVMISYQPPAGGLGTGLAFLLNPLFKNMVESDIENFKQYMDIGDVQNELLIVG